MRLNNLLKYPSSLRNMNTVTKLRIVLVTSAILLAILVIILSTRWGAALGDDSYSYIKPARDALAGESMAFHPSFPPFLPLLLAGIGLFGVEPLEAIRYLNAILFGITILLTFLIVIELSGSFSFSFLASIAILLSSGLIEVFASAFSEPLYICLMLISIYGAILYSRNVRKFWLFLTAITAGFAVFTRYIGIALIVSIAVFLVLKVEKTWREKAKSTLLFLVISSIPIAGFALRNLLLIGRSVGQSGFSWLLVKEFPLRLLLRGVFDWFIPSRLVAGLEEELTLLSLTLVIGLFLGYYFVYRQRLTKLAKDLVSSPSLVLLSMFIVFTLVLLSVARGFFAGGDPFNPRYITPVQIAVFMLSFGILAKVFSATDRGSHLVISGFCLGIFVLLGLRAVYTIQVLYTNGSGYSSSRWHISETIAYLNRRPDTPVMSTAAAGVYFWTGRRPKDLPRSNYREAVGEFLCDTGGFLVIIDSMPAEFYGIDHAELTEGLTVEQDFSEGTIYRLDPSECE